MTLSGTPRFFYAAISLASLRKKNCVLSLCKPSLIYARIQGLSVILVFSANMLPPRTALSLMRQAPHLQDKYPLRRVNLVDIH